MVERLNTAQEDHNHTLSGLRGTRVWKMSLQETSTKWKPPTARLACLLGFKLTAAAKRLLLATTLATAQVTLNILNTHPFGKWLTEMMPPVLRGASRNQHLLALCALRQGCSIQWM